MKKNIEEFLKNATTEELENLINDYFNLLDGVYHEGNTSSPSTEEIERRDGLLAKYKIFN